MLSTVAPMWMWVVFAATVIAMLVLDLGVLHRKSHEVSTKEAVGMVFLWVSIALLFCAGVYLKFGSEKALEFLAGYVIEEALSVDNLFVFVLIFQYFSVPEAYKHRVLFWGILGAVIFRAIFVFAGAALLAAFHWVIFIFGGFLIYTGIKLFFSDDKEIEPEKNIIIRTARRFLPISNSYAQDRFFIRYEGKRFATPLFVVLLAVEGTDIVFAVDSIPAVFGVSRDPFIVYTSNIFAILGLRALYFLVAQLIKKLRYLQYGLALVLTFVGIKMVIADYFHISIGLSLGIVSAILVASGLASLVIKEKKETTEPEHKAASGSP